MRRILTPCFCLLLFAAASRPALAMEDWEVRHLLTRAGFGVSPGDYERFKPMKMDKAVDELLAGVRTEPVTPIADSILNIPEPDREALKLLPEEQRREKNNEYQRLQRQAGQDLKAWWYQEMLATDSPLTERMTLFWSNHFTSSLQKVKDPRLMVQQNALLRRQALGNFKTMTHAIARDPAMLIYLDNQSNRKGRPNENFARELMELFTMGIGNYSEQDIKEAARALTGWTYNRREQKAVFNPRQHDDGPKTFLGRTGNFTGEEIVEIIMEQPQTARHITAKLWKEFISPTPDAKEVDRISEIFRKSNYEIKPLVRALLLTKAFRDSKTQGMLVKSPVDLLVGTARTFSVQVEEPMALVRFGKQLEQDLFDPPNVKGWVGGESWINSNTLLQRQQVLRAVVTGPDPDRREMSKAANRPQRPVANRKKGNQSGGTEAKSMIPAQDQALFKRIRELRQEGLQRGELVTRLEKEGHRLTEVRAALDSRRSAVANSGNASPAKPEAKPAVPEMMADGDTMMMQEAAPARPTNRNPAMPRADIEGWMSQVVDARGAQAEHTIASLLVPVVPLQTRLEMGHAVPVRELLLDPVFQLK